MRERILPLSLVATAITALLVVPAVTAGSPAMAVPGTGSPVFVNEIHYDNDGTDSGEAIEVVAPAGTDLTGWSLVLYNGSATVRATYNTRALSGVVPDQGAGFGTVAFSYPVDGIQNGSPDGIALVNGSTVVQFLSYEGVFEAANGPAMGQTSTDIGVTEASTTPVGQSLQLSGTGLTATDFTWGAPTPSSFGQLNAGQTFGTPGTTTTTSSTTTTTLPPTRPCLPTPAVTPISEVQGTTDTTPCPAGRAITIEGVVVGDYEGPAPTLRGFYVQEQDDQQDGDLATSEGVFVFNGSADSVTNGDVVTVTGRAVEFEGQTQLTDATVVPTGTTGTVTAAEVTLPFPDPTFVERYEGMLVHFRQELSVTEHFQLGRFGQIVVSSGGRLRQPTTVVEPGDPARALQAANNLNRIIVDDELNNQNRDPIVFGRGGNPLSAANTLRGGDTVADLLGVMTFTWAGNSASGNAYRVRPIGALGGGVPNFAAANPRPATPPSVNGDLRIANFNVLNYFLTPDVGTTPACGPNGSKQECRGANNATELQRQRAKLLAALIKLDADVIGLIEIENSDSTVPGAPPVNPLADIVDGLNAIVGPGTYAYVDTGLIGTDTIRVGIVYRPGVVSPVRRHAILDSSVDERFDDDRNRPSLAQTFSRNSTGEIFTVVVNHLKSKSCDNTAGPGDIDSGDGAACFNATRTAAAEALVAWMRRHPTGVTDDDFIVMGDFNAYAKETPMDVFAAAGFVDLVAASDPNGYSFAFDGQWGALDYALASASFAAQSRGAADYHINADEPTVLDYNTEFKSPGQVTSLFEPDEFRTSDHDPVISGYDLNALRRATLIPLPFLLWPPNHKLVTVDVFGFDDLRRLDVEILKVESSEADANLGPDDLPGDIVRIDNDTYRLRAERFHRNGRRYTITALVTNGRQSSIETTTVFVPHSFFHR